MALQDYVSQFNRARVLVVGDAMLDEYVHGDIHRISAEAPIPILSAGETRYVPGGAANVAHNIATLGARASIVGQIGADRAGKTLRHLLRTEGIKTHFIENRTVPTTLKTRYLAQNQQVLRVDREEYHALSAEDLTTALAHVKAENIDAIIISDYNKGVVTKEGMDVIRALGKQFIVDPKPVNAELFVGAYAISPNAIEAEAIAAHTGARHTTFDALGRYLATRLQTNVIITRGKDGVSLFPQDGSDAYSTPAKAREVYDVSGAGDTFIAAVALATAVGANLRESVELGNAAASVVVGKRGTATLTKEELLERLSDEK